MDKNSSTSKRLEIGPTPRVIRQLSDDEARDGSPKWGTSGSPTSKGAAAEQVRATSSPPPEANGTRDSSRASAPVGNSEQSRLSEPDELRAAARHIHQRNWQSLSPLLDDIKQKARQLMSTAISEFAHEVQERVNYQSSLILENFDVQANGRLATNVDRAVGRVEDCRGETEQNLRALAAHSQMEIQRASTCSVQELRRVYARNKGELEKQAQGRIDELRKTGNEMTAELRHVGQIVSEELQRSTDEMLRELESRLHAVTEQTLAKAEGLINELTTDCIRVVENEAKKIVNREVSKALIEALRTWRNQLERLPY